MESYPKIVSESETLDAVLDGRSITRFGDGEFRLAMGAVRNVSQIAHRKLRSELCEILSLPQAHCLVAIPNITRESPKYESCWSKYERKYPRLLNPAIRYYSSFVTRPDSAPWIDIPEYYDRMESLWADREVVLVRGSERSLVEGREPMDVAAKVHVVTCPYRDAYDEIDRVESAVRALGVKRVILCAGAMATVLAYRLSQYDVQAIDLGHIGFLWRYYLSRQRRTEAFRGIADT